MKRHIKALGLGSVEEYRSWCRSQGYAPELSKNVRQIDQELRTYRADIEITYSKKKLDNHIDELGFDSVDEYRSWCKSNNLNESLNKSASQRKREIQLKQQLDFTAADRGYADAKGNAMRVAKSILNGEIAIDDITHPGLRRIAELFDVDAETTPDHGCFLRILEAVLSKGDFLDVNPVIERLGRAAGNTLIDGLFSVAVHADSWIRAPEAWTPASKGLHKRFNELVRHLFARYAVPRFMDSVWFEGAGDEAIERQQWFIHLGNGGNIRTAGLPMEYSKKMAHLFLQAPDNYSVIDAVRWGQVLALGGSRELVGHLSATALGTNLENEEFWISVIHFFVNNPMLDLDYVGPIVEYINRRKFLREEQIGDDGNAFFIDPPDPGFTMKGRKAEPLVELVDEWHLHLTREQKIKTVGWAASGIPPFELVEKDRETGHRVKWTIDELLTRKEMFDEGKSMKHCVRSYIPSCERGIKSVWSLCYDSPNTTKKKRVLTIAVKNDMRKVVQARGKCNAMPDHHPVSQQAARVLRREEEILADGRRIMQMWGDANDIVVPRYT